MCICWPVIWKCLLHGFDPSRYPLNSFSLKRSLKSARSSVTLGFIPVGYHNPEWASVMLMALRSAPALIIAQNARGKGAMGLPT